VGKWVPQMAIPTYPIYPVSEGITRQTCLWGAINTEAWSSCAVVGSEAENLTI